jgi:hypothetical protein
MTATGAAAGGPRPEDLQGRFAHLEADRQSPDSFRLGHRAGEETGRNEFSIRIVSASGIPLPALGPIRHLTVKIPKLPLGLVVQGVSVTTEGVVLGVTGSNISFGQ